MLMVGDEQTTNRQAYELFFCNMRFDLPKLKMLHTKFSAEQIEAEKKNRFEDWFGLWTNCLTSQTLWRR